VYSAHSVVLGCVVNTGDVTMQKLAFAKAKQILPHATTHILGSQSVPLRGGWPRTTLVSILRFNRKHGGYAS
jgi:hypothetical protein